MCDKCIRLWCWHDAPEDYRKLSGHGGDEDWLLYCPANVTQNYWPLLLGDMILGDETSYLTGFGHVDRHELPDGGIVVIFSHA